MDIKAELEANRQKQKEIATELNQLEAQKQALLQEMLQMQGEMRLLTRMKNEQASKGSK